MKGQPRSKHSSIRHLVLIPHDHLDLSSSLLRDLDRSQDLLWMAEAPGELTRVWSHRARMALFLSAMRHFREALDQKGTPCRYRELSTFPGPLTLAQALREELQASKPEKVRMHEPGDWAMGQEIRSVCTESGVPLEVVPDETFLCSTEEFRKHASGRKQMRMEFFYREMRKKHRVLMEGDQPEGGEWNFDKDNRQSFGRSGPDASVREHLGFAPDAITRQVIREIEERFPTHPGSCEHFDWPVTREQALELLKDFVHRHLPDFGSHQDAMWTKEPYLHHSRLSAAMNLKLIHAREIIEAAEKAYRKRRAPLPSVEGFIRQILGWREYVRGVYHLLMPGYVDRNHLKAKEALPSFFWSAENEFQCLKDTLTQTLDRGYAHHIQRLMVTGLFCLLLGVDPKEVHRWYLAVYVDAHEWVELPNTLGMSQYGDGGVMASKPYIASGKYISRMSNYCSTCPRNPEHSTGKTACPFTLLYWDFIGRHEKLLQGNPRIGAQVLNWKKMSPDKRSEIVKEARLFREGLRRS